MLEIDKMSRVPIYEQVIQKLELLILTNVLGPNSPLPSFPARDALSQRTQKIF